MRGWARRARERRRRLGDRPLTAAALAVLALAELSPGGIRRGEQATRRGGRARRRARRRELALRLDAAANLAAAEIYLDRFAEAGGARRACAADRPGDRPERHRPRALPDARVGLRACAAGSPSRRSCSTAPSRRRASPATRRRWPGPSSTARTRRLQAGDLEIALATAAGEHRARAAHRSRPRRRPTRPSRSPARCSRPASRERAVEVLVRLGRRRRARCSSRAAGGPSASSC